MSIRTLTAASVLALVVASGSALADTQVLNPSLYNTPVTAGGFVVDNTVGNKGTNGVQATGLSSALSNKEVGPYLGNPTDTQSVNANVGNATVTAGGIVVDNRAGDKGANVVGAGVMSLSISSVNKDTAGYGTNGYDNQSATGVVNNSSADAMGYVADNIAGKDGFNGVQSSIVSGSATDREINAGGATNSNAYSTDNQVVDITAKNSSATTMAQIEGNRVGDNGANMASASGAGYTGTSYNTSGATTGSATADTQVGYVTVNNVDVTSMGEVNANVAGKNGANGVQATGGSANLSDKEVGAVGPTSANIQSAFVVVTNTDVGAFGSLDGNRAGDNGANFVGSTGASGSADSREIGGAGVFTTQDSQSVNVDARNLNVMSAGLLTGNRAGDNGFNGVQSMGARGSVSLFENSNGTSYHAQQGSQVATVSLRNSNVMSIGALSGNRAGVGGANMVTATGVAASASAHQVRN